MGGPKAAGKSHPTVDDDFPKAVEMESPLQLTVPCLSTLAPPDTMRPHAVRAEAHPNGCEVWGKVVGISEEAPGFFLTLL